MKTVDIRLKLPDQLARQAADAGLLSEQAIEGLIEDALRRQAGRQLLDAMERLRAANVPPLTDEEIAAEVAAVRHRRQRE
jgi:cytochrome P450